MTSDDLSRGQKMTWPEVQNDLTDVSSSITISLAPALALLKWSMSGRQWNAGQPEMNLIAVSARLQVIASFWKNKINFDKMAPEMQPQCLQYRIRISIISPIFQLALISRSEKRPFSRCLPAPILKPIRRRDGDVTAPELPRSLTIPGGTYLTIACEGPKYHHRGTLLSSITRGGPLLLVTTLYKLRRFTIAFTTSCVSSTKTPTKSSWHLFCPVPLAYFHFKSPLSGIFIWSYRLHMMDIMSWLSLASLHVVLLQTWRPRADLVMRVLRFTPIDRLRPVRTVRFCLLSLNIARMLQTTSYIFLVVRSAH